MKIIFDSEEEKKRFCSRNCVAEMIPGTYCKRAQNIDCAECFILNGIGIEVESIERTEDE